MRRRILSGRFRRISLSRPIPLVQHPDGDQGQKSKERRRIPCSFVHRLFSTRTENSPASNLLKRYLAGRSVCREKFSLIYQCTVEAVKNWYRHLTTTRNSWETYTPVRSQSHYFHSLVVYQTEDSSIGTMFPIANDQRQLVLSCTHEFRRSEIADAGPLTIVHRLQLPTSTLECFRGWEYVPPILDRLS